MKITVNELDFGSMDIRINGESHTLRTHSGDDFNNRYKAQDLLKAYGFDSLRAKQRLQNWVRSLESSGKVADFPTFTGRTGGTYLTKRELLKLAGFIDADFEDAVYEAFELITEGQLRAASDKVTGWAISSELKSCIKEASQNLNTAIMHWSGKPHDWDLKFTMIRMNKIISHVVSNGSIESIKRYSQAKSLADYFIKSGHREGCYAYIAACENLTNALDIGLDYKQCKRIMKYKTLAEIKAEQAANKEVKA